MLDPLFGTLEHTPARAPTRYRPTIVLESHSSPWPLDTVLRLHAAHPTVRMLRPVVESRADSIADAFRRGAHAYIVGSGKLDTDLTLIDDIASGQSLFEPTPDRDASGRPTCSRRT